MSDMSDKCEKMIGLYVSNKTGDYGRIMKWEIVNKDGKDYYVFIFSSGRKVEANSLIKYVETYIHYPQGTDYVMRQRIAHRKAKGMSGGSMFGSSIKNVAHFRDSKGK